jgi:hypothetical protein
VIAQTTVQPTVGRIDLDWKPMQVGKSAAIVPITQDEAIRILERSMSRPSSSSSGT